MKDSNYDIVINGLLSGYKVENSNVCITNNIRSVFVVKPIRCKTQECINCGNCLNYCPVGADPKTGYKRPFTVFIAGNGEFKRVHIYIGILNGTVASISSYKRLN